MSKLEGEWEQLKSAVNSVVFDVPTDSSPYQEHWLTYDILNSLFNEFSVEQERWETLKYLVTTYANNNLEIEDYPVPELK